MAAACASWFDGPTTKLAKVCLGLMSSGGGATRRSDPERGAPDGGETGSSSLMDARRGEAEPVSGGGGDEGRTVVIGRGRTGGSCARFDTGSLRFWSTVQATCTLQP